MRVWLTLDNFRDLCYNLATNAIWASHETIPDFETRYPGILESCLENPRQTFEGQFLYPTLVKQAAILFYLLIKNHPFVNGNKRIAVTALLVFLFLNGRWLTVQKDALHEITVKVAASDPQNMQQILAQIEGLLVAHLSEAE